MVEALKLVRADLGVSEQAVDPLRAAEFLETSIPGVLARSLFQQLAGIGFAIEDKEM